MPDLSTLAIALVLWAAFGGTSLAALTLAFLCGWVLVELALRSGRLPKKALPRPLALWTLALVALVPALQLAEEMPALLRAEGLAGLDAHLSDRWALERTPAIFPRLVVPNRPLTYFVSAPGAEVALELGELRLEGEALGHGVFRVELDAEAARRIEPGPATIEVAIVTGGSRARRTLSLAPALEHPRALSASPDGARVCATSEETDELERWAPPDEPARVEVVGGPSACAFLDDAHVAITRRFADAILVRGLDGETRSYPVGLGASAIAVDEAARRIAVLRTLGGRGELVLVEPDRGEDAIVARRRLPGDPDLLAFDDVGAVVVASRAPARIERFVPRGAELVPAAARALAMPAVALTTARDGRELLVAVTAWSDAGTPELGNHFAQDEIVTLESRTLELRRRFPTGRRSERQDHAGDVDRGVSPLGLAIDERGALIVAFAGSDEVVRIPGARGDAPSIETWDVAALGASAPSSVAALSGGRIALASPSSGLLALVEEDRDPRPFRLGTDDATLLRARPEALRARMGERAFYEGTRSGVSCQTCHTHGGSDGAAHNIGGRVLAPTLDTRGIGGTSPYLRDGSYPRVRDLMSVAESEYRGYRLPAGDRGLTIEGYLDSLPPGFVVRERAPERERAGLDAFFRAGCPDCHAPPAFTGLGEHPVHVVFPDLEVSERVRVLDAPSLRGVVASAPYLFDGRAETLADVLTTHNASDEHGHTAALSDEERADLVVFLESL